MKPNLKTSAYDRYLAFRASIAAELPPVADSLPTVSTYHEHKGGYVPRRREGWHKINKKG